MQKTNPDSLNSNSGGSVNDKAPVFRDKAPVFHDKPAVPARAPVVLNADDFGLCPGVNRGICDAHKNGILTSTTLMANMPFAGEAVEMARGFPKLGIGVHLNLVDGKSLCRDFRVKAITGNDWDFKYSPGKLAALSILCPKVREAIRLELGAQVEWILNAGIKPTHMDSHKHVHASPGVFKIAMELAGKYGIEKIRNVFEPAEISGGKWPKVSSKDKGRAAALRMMGRVNQVQGRRVFKTSGLLGVAHTGKISVEFLKMAAEFARSGGCWEIMTHPGYTDGLENAGTRLVKERKFELDSLVSEQTIQCFRDCGIKLVHYGQI